MRGRTLPVALAAGLVVLSACHGRPRVDTRAPSPPRRLTTGAGLDAFPAFSPDGRFLACASDASGAFEIHLVSLDGKSDVALTHDRKQNVEPAFSPDGRLVVYHSKARGGLWLVPADGGAPRPLADFGSKPAFSPDGELVAFQSEPLTDLLATGALPPSTIWVVPSRGGPARDVTREGAPAGGHGAPTFSPDGKRIFFVATDPKFDQSTLFSVALDGGSLTRHAAMTRLFDPVVTPDGEAVLFGGGSPQRAYDVFRAPLRGSSREAKPIGLTGIDLPRHLALSPDGRRLALSSTWTNGNLFSLPMDAKTSLPSGPPRPLTSGRKARSAWPVISPDGRTIAFGRLSPGSSPDVYLMDADGRNERPLLVGPANDVARDFFPSGEALLVNSNRGGEDGVYTLDVESGKLTTLAISAKDMAYPRLSPDGKSLAYGSRAGGKTVNTWVADIATGQRRALTFDREFFGFPFWSPDGKTVGAQIARGDDFHVAEVPAAGGEPRQLTFTPGLAWPFSFSPDGERIAFAGCRGGVWNVYWVARATREEKRLTSFESLNTFVRYPAWSRAGDQIVFEYAETTGNVFLVTFGKKP